MISAQPAEHRKKNTMSTTTPRSEGAPADAGQIKTPLTSRSISLRALVSTVVASGLVAASGVLAWQLHNAQSELAARDRDTADKHHAEQVALDYAVGAATMNFQDLTTWKTKLTAGTNSDLTNKLNNAAQSMEQIIVPLQWVSTPTPLTATVRSETAGIYIIDTYVSVLIENTQAPDGLRSR